MIRSASRTFSARMRRQASAGITRRCWRRNIRPSTTQQRLDFPFTLTARAENLIRGKKDLDDTIRRLQAFEAAGADVLYAPGLTTLDEVRLVASALTKPLNVLALPLKGATVALMAAAGARRISTGGALARAALTALLRAGTEMVTQGSFGWASDVAPNADVKRWLGAEA